MNENTPFTDHVSRGKGPTNSTLPGWIAAVLMAIAAVVFALLWSSARVDQQKLDALQTKLGQTTGDVANGRAENQQARDQITALQSKVADLEKEKEVAAGMARGLEEEMRADLESKDVTISKLQGKLTVNILDRIMFDSGEAVLKLDGQPVMQKIADLLAKHPELKIQVIGHTDNVPIRAGARNRFASNWELSTARALAAVHFLTEHAGVDPRRVGAVGFGEFRPIADNATADGRAKNRRIAITILPDELAGVDTVLASATNSVTNSVPIVSSPPPGSQSK